MKVSQILLLMLDITPLKLFIETLLKLKNLPQKSLEVQLKWKKIRRTNMKNLKYFTLVLQLGLNIMSGILAGLVIGILLDKWLHTNKVFTLIFLIIGIMSSANQTYRYFAKLTAKKKNKDSKDKKDD